MGTYISQINKAFLAFYGAGRWDLFSSFFSNTHLDWKKDTQSQLGKKKAPCFDLFRGKTTFLPVFFVLKVKPKKLCKLNQSRH